MSFLILTFSALDKYALKWILYSMWNVDFSDEYSDWFDTLDRDCKIAVLQRIDLLKEFGPQLPRPYSDVLHGTKYVNLKELRTKTEKHILRISYIFDKERKAFLLIGGDKKGKVEKDFYKELIRISENLVEKYLLK